MATQVIYNEYGEPIGTEYVRDQWEQEEAEWEEDMRCAEDPLYAASKENQRWYNAACAAFEERGITVPDDVIRALAREMRIKQREEEEAKALAVAQPAVDLLNELLPASKAKAYYYPETVDECSFTEIHFNGQWPTRAEVENAIAVGIKKDIYIEDYIGSLHYYK